MYIKLNYNFTTFPHTGFWAMWKDTINGGK